MVRALFLIIWHRRWRRSTDDDGDGDDDDEGKKKIKWRAEKKERALFWLKELLNPLPLFFFESELCIKVFYNFREREREDDHECCLDAGLAIPYYFNSILSFIINSFP